MTNRLLQFDGPVPSDQFTPLEIERTDFPASRTGLRAGHPLCASQRQPFGRCLSDGPAELMPGGFHFYKANILLHEGRQADLQLFGHLHKNIPILRFNLDACHFVHP